MITEAPIAMGGPGGVAGGRHEPETPTTLRHGYAATAEGLNPAGAIRMAIEPAAPGDPDRTDSAAPFKRMRKRHRQTTEKVSILGMRELWLVPYLAEITLLLGATWLTLCLQRVVREPGAGFPLASLAVLVAAYAGLAVYSRIHELFLPRAVVFIGVGTLFVIGAGLSIGLQVDSYLMGGRAKLTNALLVLTPVHLFVLRCVLIFREARFTPSTTCLARRVGHKSDKLAELRRTLRFWLS